MRVVDTQQRLVKADDLKLEGNELFKASKWSEALTSYRTALSQLPPQQRSVEPDIDPSDTDLDTPEDHGQPSGRGTSASASPGVPNELEVECSKARAVLYANIGACLLKLVSSNELPAASKTDRDVGTGGSQRSRRCVHSR
jgi:hypothetical protein